MKHFQTAFILILLMTFNCLSQNKQETETTCGSRDYICQIAEITDVINANPKVAENYVRRGALYIGIENFFVAHRDFNKAIELNPTYAEAYLGNGETFFIEGNLSSAFDEYEKVLKFNPKFAGTYYFIGKVYNSYANYQKAVENYDQAIELDADNYIFYYGRGVAFFYLNKQDLAINDLKKAIELEPDDIASYASLGTAYGELGNNEEKNKMLNFVIEQTTKLIEADPNNYGLFNQRGLAYSNLTIKQNPDGDEPDVQDYYSAITLKPNNYEAYQYLGANSYKKGKFKEAIKYFTKAIELNPEFAELYRARAMAYQYIKEKSNAAADNRKYNELSRKALK